MHLVNTRYCKNALMLRWLNTVLRAVSGNSCDGECFKQTQRRKSNGKKKTISQNLRVKIL